MKTSLYLILFLLLFSTVMPISAVAVDEETADSMAEFDKVISEIKNLPGAIDEDLCSGDTASYRSHMTELAQKIIEANTIIKDISLYYPIDLWSIYNLISYNPTCGAGNRVADAFGIADISRISNEEKMGLRENDDLCPCWNIATGRDELAGYWKDGACRCIYGINNHSPNIGK